MLEFEFILLLIWGLPLSRKLSFTVFHSIPQTVSMTSCGAIQYCHPLPL